MLKDLGRNDLRGCSVEFSAAGLSFRFSFTLFVSVLFTLGRVSVLVSAQQPSQPLPWAVLVALSKSSPILLEQDPHF